MDENEETVEITGINSQGEGITRIMGKVYFVPNTVPGDWIIPLEMIEKKTFGQIPRFKIVKKSPYRQTPQCSYFENCGGCQYLHIAYEKQLEIKKDLLSGLLKKIAKVENAQEIVKKTVPSPKIFGYRNRAQFHKRGNSIGFFKQNSHEIMDIDRCILLEEQIMDFPEKIKANPQEFSTEILLASTICTEWDPNSSLPRVWTTRGLGEESFFSQINNQVNQLLIKKLQSIQNKNNNNAHLLDLYCGNGNLSIAIAPFFATITGVDLSKINIQQAKAKVDRKKFHYIQSDCLKYLKKQVSQLSQIKSTPPPFHSIVLDTPRKGAKELIPLFLQMRPHHIFYISCNPATLSRDIAPLLQDGYTLKTAIPFDMFPQTAHIESLIHLELTIKC